MTRAEIIAEITNRGVKDAEVRCKPLTDANLKATLEWYDKNHKDKPSTLAWQLLKGGIKPPFPTNAKEGLTQTWTKTARSQWCSDHDIPYDWREDVDAAIVFLSKQQKEITLDSVRAFVKKNRVATPEPPKPKHWHGKPKSASLKRKEAKENPGVQLTADQTELKAHLAMIREESERLTDNIDRKDVAQTVLLAVTASDMANIRLLTAQSRFKNHAVMLRNLINKAAKECLEALEAKEKEAGKKSDQSPED